MRAKRTIAAVAAAAFILGARSAVPIGGPRGAEVTHLPVRPSNGQASRGFTAAGHTAAPSAIGATTAPGDACSLLTQAEVSGVLGASLEVEHNSVSADHCAWHEPGVPVFTSKRVEVTTIDPDAFAIEKKRPVPGFPKTAVSGIGDDAYYTVPDASPASNFLTILSVKKGSAAFFINVLGKALSLDQKKAMEKALAQDALARL